MMFNSLNASSELETETLQTSKERLATTTAPRRGLVSHQIPVRPRPQKAVLQRSSPTILAKREIIDLTAGDEDTLSNSKRKRPSRARGSSTRDESFEDIEERYRESNEAVKKPKKSETPTLRVDETTRKVLNSHESVSDDELGSERKIPNKASSKQATRSSYQSKSVTPKPQSSQLGISEASQSTLKNPNLLPPKPSHPHPVKFKRSQSAAKNLNFAPPKANRPDPVKFKAKTDSLKLEISRSTSTSSSPLNSALGEIPVAQSNTKELRRHFLRNLDLLTGPSVRLINEIDDSSPNLSFTFVNSSIIGEGVETVDEGFMSGCTCRVENGRNCGCEYRYCSCLQHSAIDGSGNHHFPYSAAVRDRGCLRPFYLNSRHHIYECNKNCNCQSNCKNKVVQHGRQVPLEIFKTEDRGWGLRCTQDLLKGQFIDTYRGEIITNDEAERREKTRTVDQNNYFMNFDKHTPDRMMTAEELEAVLPHSDYMEIERQVQKGNYETETFKDHDGQEVEHWLNPQYRPPYVCDGMNHGGPSKFMNHSCEPNCRIFTASYNHADQNIYDIAFFAAEFIPARTELTFDYKDEDDRAIITDEMADTIEAKHGYRPTRCLCASKSCRGYFFN